MSVGICGLVSSSFGIGRYLISMVISVSGYWYHWLSVSLVIVFNGCWYKWVSVSDIRLVAEVVGRPSHSQCIVGLPPASLVPD